MFRTKNWSAILRSLSMGPAIALVLLSSANAFAEARYAITVVQEAQVMKGPSTSAGTRLTCTNEVGEAKRQTSLNLQAPGMSGPIRLMRVQNDVALVATRYVNDWYTNSVTIWLEARDKAGVSYYPLTTIDMENSELPKLRLDSNVLTIEAAAMKPDPNEQNYFLVGDPTLPTPLYRTVRLGARTAEGIPLTILSCMR